VCPFRPVPAMVVIMGDWATAKMGIQIKNTYKIKCNPKCIYKFLVFVKLVINNMHDVGPPYK